MTQPVDQIDQLLLDAVVASDSTTSFQQVQTADNTKLKQVEKLIEVVASEKSKRYLGKVMTTNAAVNGQLELTLLKGRQRLDTVSMSNLKVNKFREW